MNLTIASASVPAALIPLPAVAKVLGVTTDEAAGWCESRQMLATLHLGRWWVSVADLTDFVERSTWKLVAPAPSYRPARLRRRPE